MLRLTGHALVTTALAGPACGNRDVSLEAVPAPSASVSALAAESNQPWRLTSIEAGRRDALGRPLRVGCVTCHSLRKPEALPRSAEDLDEFHVGLRFEHGDLRCASCHALGPLGAHDVLRLSDATLIPMRDAMKLCAQCHGPQHRDYARGAHGGMSGHWDPATGPRTRNHCVDCHDPHAPAFQPTMPVLPPRDRGLGSPVERPGGVAIPRLSGRGGHP